MVFEGGEGSGKSTQSKRLYDYLQGLGIKSDLVREPGGTPMAEQIRRIIISTGEDMSRLPETEYLLFAAARAELFGDRIIPELEKGNHVLSDRSYISSRVYQGIVEGVDLSFMDYVNNFVTRGVIPDLVFIFDVDPKIGLEAKTKEEVNRFELEDLEFHQNVRRAYLEIAEQNENYVLVERDRDEIKTHELVRFHVKDRLNIG